MKVLHVTHTFLWFVLNRSHLSDNARQILEDSSTDAFISPASYWEMAIKYERANWNYSAVTMSSWKKGSLEMIFRYYPFQLATPAN